MPISQQHLLQILPNAGQSAGVFVPALNTAMNHYQNRLPDMDKAVFHRIAVTRGSRDAAVAH